VRQASITAVIPSLFSAGNVSTFTVLGKNFSGRSQASGGSAGSADSGHHHPRILLQSMDGSSGSSSQGSGGFLVDLSTALYRGQGTDSAMFGTQNDWAKVTGQGLTQSSFTVIVSTTNSRQLPFGWYQLRVANNAIYSDGQVVQVGPPTPSTTVANLVGTPLANTSNTIVYTWSWPNLGPQPDGYALYSASTSLFIATASFTNPTFSHTGLGPNTTAAISVAGFTISGDGPLKTSATTYTGSTVAVNVQITTITVDSFQLTWEPNGNAPGTYYEVSISTDDPSSNSKQPFTTSFSTPFTVGNDPQFFNNLTTTTVQITGLVANTTYYARVRSFNGNFLAANFSGPYTSSAVTRTPVTGVTSNLCNSGIDDAYCIRWSWNPVSAIEFRVYNATTNMSSPFVTVPGGTYQFDDAPLGTNTARAIRVSAVTAVGEGPLSASVTEYTRAAPPIFNAPDVIYIDTGTLTFSFNRNGNPSGTKFELQVGTTSSIAQSTVASTSGDANPQMTISSLKANDIFFSSVVAYDQLNRPSLYSARITTATHAASVSNLRVTGSNSSSVNLAWDLGVNTTSTTYQVTYSSDNFVNNISTAVSFFDTYRSLTASISSLQTGVAYQFRVVAFNVYGKAASAVQVATTTPSGGASAGSLAGAVDPTAVTVIEGTLGNGRYVSLFIPAHTFPSPVTVTISSKSVATGLCPGSTNFAVDITVDPPMQPVEPVQFQMRYRTPPDVPNSELGTLDPNKVIVYNVDDITGKCVPLRTTIDTTNKLISTQMNHFSVKVVGQLNPAETTDAARAFPNPFFTATDGFVTFENLPAYARLRIFTSRGELVNDLSANGVGLATWPGINHYGRDVASGVYMVVVEDTGREQKRKILKVAVIR
jgi:hypothetical protein